MRGGSALLACLGTLLTLALCAPAQAANQPRIINGQPASQGEYPAQGALHFGGGQICGGTLVSNRYFLTAGHCVTDDDDNELPFGSFSVKLGSLDRDAGETFQFADLDVHENFVVVGVVPDFDVAVFRLQSPAPADYEPIQMIGSDQASLWSAVRPATLIVWGRTTNTPGSDSQILLETTAPMRSDEDCDLAYGSDFHSETMVCAGNGATDTCQGDSGGPMMVSDGSLLVLAGITSWGDLCASSSFPGVYTRLGAPALNQWVRDRVPTARATVSDATPERGQTVTFSVTATFPGDPSYFTDFEWDFDSNGTPDATGTNPSHAYPTGGQYVARVTASGAGEDTAVAKVGVGVPVPPPVVAPPPVVTAPPPMTTRPAPRANLATILASGRPLVRRGRFKLRINFAADAPPGIAVIEVFRGKKKIGTAKGRVRRGGSRQVTVKLTKTGRRLLRRSESGRLRVTVKVRVRRQVLRSKRLTIRR